MHNGAQLSWRRLNTCLPRGNGELILCFLLACGAFALPIKLSLPQPTSFLTFTLWILSSIPLRWEWEHSGVVLTCLPKSKHDTREFSERRFRGCHLLTKSFHIKKKKLKECDCFQSAQFGLLTMRNIYNIGRIFSLGFLSCIAFNLLIFELIFSRLI